MSNSQVAALRAVLEHTPTGLCVIDGRDLHGQWCNAAYRRFLGGTTTGTADVAGRPVSELIPGYARNGVEAAVRAAVDSGAPFVAPEHEVRSAGGRVAHWRWTLTVLPAAGGRATGEPAWDLMVQAVDVTDQVVARREAEASAARAEGSVAQLQAILGSTEEGIAVSDTAGNQLYMNPAGRRIHGYGPDDDVRGNLSGFAGTFELRRYADGRVLRVDEWPLARALRGEAFSGFEVVVRRVGREQPLVVSYSGTQVRLRGGQVSSIVIGARDVTAQKQAEQDLERARRQAEASNAAKDQFLAVLSHELRTPLTPVLTAAQTLEQDRAVPESVRGTAAMIRRNVELEARLIDDLLDLTRISRGKLRIEFTRVDLHEKIRNVVQILEDDLRAKRLQLGVSLAARRRVIRGDPARVQQVIWNLVKNAAKFTPAGGRVTVATSDSGDREVVVEVVDTGVGIDPEVLPKIFDAFEQGGRDVTRQFGGLGLGLAVSRVLVQLHGGSIEAQSDGPGRGARFAVRLPVLLEAPRGPAGGGGGAGESSGLARLDAGGAGSGTSHLAGGNVGTGVAHLVGAKGGAGNARTAPTAPRADRRRLRILLVEDHEDTAAVLSMVLGHQGHSVRTAGTVAEGLQSALAEPFDLLVSDVGLPDGSGLDLMRQLRMRRETVTGIALSGFGMEEDVRRSKEAGFAEHLTKPVSLDVLEATIARVLAAAGDRGAG